MTPLNNPTTDTLMKAMTDEFAEVTNHLIHDNCDIEQIKFLKGQLHAFGKVGEMLGRDITLVPKQEGVKA